MSIEINHSRVHRATRRGIAFGVAAALAIAACSSDNDDDAAETEAPAETEEAAEAEETTETDAPAGTETPTDTDATVDTEAPADTDSTWDEPCGPDWELEERELNDRCILSSGEPITWSETELQNVSDIWIQSVTAGECAPEGANVVITAVEDQVLVTVDDPANLDDALGAVGERLVSAGFAAENLGSEGPPFAGLLGVSGASVTEILGLLPLLQGVGWSADLNYLEPLSPNNAFRPDDDPASAPAPPEGLPDRVQPAKTVLVLDSPDWPGIDEDTNLDPFDADGNDHWDEDHGHGEFVESIIARLAAPAAVTLQGIESPEHRLPSGRWAPMLFSDSDILDAVHAVTNGDLAFDYVNMSLGGAGCSVPDGAEWEHGVGERVALARGLRAMASVGSPDSPEGSPTVFVAAAGNQGYDVQHFPAAWVDAQAIALLAEAVLTRDPQEGTGGTEENDEVAAEILALGEYFRQADVNEVKQRRMYAVGSVEPDGTTTSPFSNCGDWVNAQALGTSQLGSYPNPRNDTVNDTAWATWSGTSFATANVTAFLVNEAVSSQTIVDGVDVTVDGLGCPPPPPPPES